jgi:glycosyltransferase involved in cell wall biosynthesis
VTKRLRIGAGMNERLRIGASASQPLRIAQIAPIAHPVHRDARDSVEQLVWLLCEELVRRGHEVTLFATGDSTSSARLSAVYAHGYEHDDSLWDWRLHESLNAAAAFERAQEFDVIHSHAYHFALQFTRLVSTPIVQTYHVEADPDILDAYRRHPEMCVIAVSEWQRSTLAGVPRTTVIHHGIDTSSFPFSAPPGEHLLFLGRMIPDKGPLEAVRIARLLGLPLILAGSSTEHFEQAVRPLLDGSQVRYAGEVDHQRRNALLSRASALLLPLTYPEPFGLVMVEAMACGTPVVATGIGAVPEIVEPGLTGCHAPSPQALAGCVPQALELDRARVRARAVERFHFTRMVDAHEALYRRVAQGAGARR